MATNQSVLQKVTEAYDEARALNGMQPIASELAAKDASITALQLKVDEAIALIDEAIAADTVADQEEAAKLQATKAKLQGS